MHAHVLTRHSQFARAFGRVFELKSGSRCIHVFVQEKVEPDGKITGLNFASFDWPKALVIRVLRRLISKPDDPPNRGPVRAV
jgi:hypothetical protein